MTFEQTDMFDMDEEPPTRLLGRLVAGARRYVYAGVGAVAESVDKVGEIRHEKIEKGIDRLAERGEREKATRLQGLSDGFNMTRGMAVTMGRQARSAAGTAVGSMTGIARERIGIAGSADVERVTQQLDELNEKIDRVVTPSIEGEQA